jgi:hypothetical protein
MGEGTRRQARREPHSGKRRPLWTASSPKAGPKWVWSGCSNYLPYSMGVPTATAFTYDTRSTMLSLPRRGIALGSSVREIDTSRTVYPSFTTCKPRKARVKLGVVNIFSCSHDDNLKGRRNVFYGSCYYTYPPVEGFLLGCASPSLCSLVKTAHFLIAARNARRS